MKPYAVVGPLVSVAVATSLACRGARGGTPDSAVADSGRIAVLGARDVARVQRAAVTAGVPVSGTLEPSVKVRISSPIPEVVDAVFVKEGEPVRRGQVLARFRIDAVGAAALSAEAQRRKAAADYERFQRLFREGAVSQSDVETQEIVLRAAEATAAQAQKRLDEGTVRAPISGTISARHVEAGNRVKDGDPLFEIVNTAELEFEATVPNEFTGTVRPGQPVALSLSGSGGGGAEPFSGRVARVNATVDPATQQLKIYVVVQNRDRRLVGGMFATGRVVERQAQSVLTVPRTALRTGSDGQPYALIVAEGIVARRNIRVGIVDEVLDLVEVTAGLQGGETVILGAAPGLAAGRPVRLTEREP